MIAIQLMWDAGADQSVALPSYETAGAAGADLRANFPEHARDGVLMEPRSRVLIPTGLRLSIQTSLNMGLNHSSVDGK